MKRLIEYRPWGKFEVLYDGEDCKLKRITVNPGGRLSLQYHYKRDEFWRIINGTATITLGDDLLTVFSGGFVEIPRTIHHRVENLSNTPLVFIETQTGDYFGEDDIVRIEDDYNRI
jgi:mannose-6-phosphate isomerase-like protein (cupin superfamily)